ncbi:MAG: hypothetical protein ACYCTY_15475 [Sulfuricella sp.]
MKTLFQKILLVSSLALSLLPATANAVWWATEWTQLMNHGLLFTQVTQSMRQLENEIQTANQLVSGLSPEALAAQSLGMQRQANQMLDLVDASTRLYGSLGNEQHFLADLQNRWGASNLSPAQWGQRELELSAAGNQQAQHTFSQAQTIFKQVQGDIDRRKQLADLMGGNPTMSQQAATTNQYLDLMAGQNAAVMQALAEQEARAGAAIQKEASQRKANADAARLYQQQQAAARAAALRALQAVKPTSF